MKVGRIRNGKVHTEKDFIIFHRNTYPFRIKKENRKKNKTV